MKAMQLISALLTILVVMPIWYYLIYQILVRVQATELMWFLYWVYVPVGIFAHVLQRIAQSGARKAES